MSRDHFAGVTVIADGNPADFEAAALKALSVLPLLDTGKVDPQKLSSVLHYDGNPVTARFIVNDISLKHGLEKPAKESVK